MRRIVNDGVIVSPDSFESGVVSSVGSEVRPKHLGAYARLQKVLHHPVYQLDVGDGEVGGGLVSVGGSGIGNVEVDVFGLGFPLDNKHYA